MSHFIGALLALDHHLRLAEQTVGKQTISRRDERGSVTTEHVLWAVAVIVIVGVVVAAVQTYVTTQAGKIN